MLIYAETITFLLFRKICFHPLQKKPARFKFDEANWPLFEQLCVEELKTGMFENMYEPRLKLNETLISIADRDIPKTSTNPKHPSKRWFDDDCE